MDNIDLTLNGAFNEKNRFDSVREYENSLSKVKFREENPYLRLLKYYGINSRSLTVLETPDYFGDSIESKFYSSWERENYEYSNSCERCGSIVNNLSRSLISYTLCDVCNDEMDEQYGNSKQKFIEKLETMNESDFVGIIQNEFINY